MIGGLGDDIYIVDSAGDTVTEAANEGIDDVHTALLSYSLAAIANVEKLTGTLAFGQELTGDALANTITSGVGADTLDGGAGADTMVGGDSDDVYYVDDAGDVVIENANEGFDAVVSTVELRAGRQYRGLGVGRFGRPDRYRQRTRQRPVQ